jgi:hypothetical protein
MGSDYWEKKIAGGGKVPVLYGISPKSAIGK